MRIGGHRVSRATFEENLHQKLSDPAFRADMTPLLRPGIDWNVDLAVEVVMRQLLSRLSG